MGSRLQHKEKETYIEFPVQREQSRLDFFQSRHSASFW